MNGSTQKYSSIRAAVVRNSASHASQRFGNQRHRVNRRTAADLIGRRRSAVAPSARSGDRRRTPATNYRSHVARDKPTADPCDLHSESLDTTRGGPKHIRRENECRAAVRQSLFPGMTVTTPIY